MSSDKVYKRERLEDYWQEISRKASAYARDPIIRKKEFFASLKYWISMVLFSFIIGPLFIFLIYWLNVNTDLSYFSFLALDAIKMLWITLSMIVFPISMLLIKPPVKLSWTKASDDIDKKNIPHNHKEF